MTRFRITSTVSAFLCAVLLTGVVGVGTARAQIVTLFDVQAVLSPDGDGKSDSTRVRYTLSAPAASLSLIVFEADSVTPVDTLRAPAAQTSGGPRVFYWKGRRWDGSLAPEGAYVVTLFARGSANPDSLKSLPVFVDVTPPRVQIVSALPNPYAPGAPGSTVSVSFSFTVLDASPTYPGRIPDELKSAFANPSGAALTPVSLTTTPPFAGANGSYVMAWNATAETSVPADGEYRVTLTLNDVAGYTATSVYHFDVDTKTPDVKVTSLAENASVSTVPDSLRGDAFDKSGVDSLMVRYAATHPYQSVASTWTSGDTLRFSVPLADSFATEGAHRVDFRAVDVFGRATSYFFNFRSDATAPPAPILNPVASSTWKTSTYPLSGHANDGGDQGSFVRVYRNGALVDSVSTFFSDDFELDVPLLPGRNDLTAVLRDGAMNASPPSNAVTVTFDTGAGVFATAPFGPGDAFDVNVSRMATRCVLRVFDLSGQVVIVLEGDGAKQFYSIPWNGINGSGLDVKKGPLVVVASIDYEDGSHDVFREVFLYDPHAP